MAVLFTSDLHLGHNNIIATCNRNEKNCGRNFSTIEEMNDFLIEKWNVKVNEDDDVYILGDLSYRSGVSVKTFLKQLKGRKHLIEGNHDYKWMKNIGDLAEFFETVSKLEVIKIDKKLITLCHYPLFEWNSSRRAKSQDTSISWIIHGHIHNSIHNHRWNIIPRNFVADGNGCPICARKSNGKRYALGNTSTEMSL